LVKILIMIRQIVHISDIHIRTFRLHEEYREVFATFLAQLKELIHSELLEASEVRIAIVGDIVHQKIVISNEQLMLGTWFIRELEKIAPVIIIAGNHDLLENNRDRMDSITPMVQFLGDANVNYFKESKCYLDDNVVWCVYSIFEGNTRPDIESARKQFGDDKTYIGLFHAPMVNAKTDLGYKFEHGAEPNIFEGCDFVLLGDIHKRQGFIHNDIKMVYPGSLVQQDFGENISKHGFLIWDVAGKTFNEYDVENKHLFYKFKITSLEDLENNLEELINK
jgi:DNA repair exonuclease SbcCD nuclease subunit